MHPFKNILYLALIFFTVIANAQVVTTEPEFPTADQPVKIIFDVKQATDGRAAGLLGLTSGVYLWSGAGSTQEGGAFEFEPSGQTNFNAAFEPGTMTFEGNDVWSITLTPRSYYSVPEGTPIVKLGLLLKNTSGSAQTEDVVIEIYEEGTFSISLNNPTQTSLLVNQNDDVLIEASASSAATFNLSVNGNVIETQSNTTSFSYSRNVTESSGTTSLLLSAEDIDGNMDEIGFTYTIRTATVEEARPSGIIRGINYNEADDTKATLCLQAPNKSSVYAIGDFSNWELDAAYQMKKDGEFFWVELSGLTPGEEYAFQYLVDETIYIADPYGDKILNGLDDFIPDNIYPNLKSYPAEAQNAIGYYNTVSVLQTGQTPFNWQVNDFEKPQQSELVIYELLVRDFFENGQESYQNLIDTLSYIKSLGVNAIELMPITEFSGNDSWGYNPTFMFAPDKAYGTKDDLKAFIDAAHGLGMAVILDVVLNQQEQPSPLILLDFNTSTGQVTAENPYFNINATHPFNVFYDMNHESTYTQSFVDSVNYYWINEYRFDGYRFDLSKGFTQTDYGNDVGAWSNYDAGRVSTLKRMADKIWEHSPNAYVILEHFASNTEETELANYGMMLWGNLHGSFKDNVNGKPGGGDIRSLYHGNRGWNNPHLVGYMESHDEERQMFFDVNEGESNNNYSVKDLDNALERVASASALLYLTPGPKMLWQFGELGYDISIDFNGRTGQKPVPWNNVEGYNFNNESNRMSLRQIMSELIELKTTYEVFTTGNATFYGNDGLKKQLVIANQSMTDNPESPNEMSVVVVANFELITQNFQVEFPHTGKWYDYFDDNEVPGVLTTLPPGTFKVFTDYNLGTEILSVDEPQQRIKVFPNPTTDFISVESNDEPLYFFLYDLTGKKVNQGKFSNGNFTIDASQLTGLGFVEVITRSGDRFVEKVVKK